MESHVDRYRTIEVVARSKRILVVDDDPTDAKVLRLTLEGQGFEVSTCTNYESALRCLETAPFDFVVVSQGSPVFEGRTVVDRAMQLDRHRPVMVTTRCINMQCCLEAMQMGAIDYLEKPVPPADLLRFVRAHVQHRNAQIQGNRF